MLARQFDDTVWTSQGSSRAPISKWTNEQILSWIASVDGVSPEIVESFCENKITGAQLLALGKEGLDDLGVKQKGVLYLLLKVSWCLNFTTRVLAVPVSDMCFYSQRK